MRIENSRLDAMIAQETAHEFSRVTGKELSAFGLVQYARGYNPNQDQAYLSVWWKGIEKDPIKINFSSSDMQFQEDVFLARVVPRAVWDHVIAKRHVARQKFIKRMKIRLSCRAPVRLAKTI